MKLHFISWIDGNAQVQRSSLVHPGIWKQVTLKTWLWVCLPTLQIYLACKFEITKPAIWLVPCAIQIILTTASSDYGRSNGGKRRVKFVVMINCFRWVTSRYRQLFTFCSTIIQHGLIFIHFKMARKVNIRKLKRLF